MKRRLFALVAFLTLIAGAASAQDPRAVLQNAVKAMGAVNMKTIQYSGAGWARSVGQSYNLTSHWPRFEVPIFMRVIDYDAKSWREERTRRQGNYPTYGRLPLQEEKITALLSGNFAWNMKGDNPVPQTGRFLEGPPIAELRQLEIALTPHGFLKAALAGNPTAMSEPIVGPSDGGLSSNGRKVTIVSFTALGKYKVNGTINDEKLVELVSTWIPNPVYGDMLYEWRYTEYKDFGGIQFPAVVHVHQGDQVLNPEHNIMEIKVNNVQANLNVPAVTVPDVVQKAAAPAERVDTQKLADGVWLIAGGTHNSVAVEFADFVAVVEAPLNEARSLAVIAEVHRLFPNKQIKYVVSTHHHFDHAGGLRTYVHEGAIPIAHRDIVPYYYYSVMDLSPRTLEPDRLSLYPPDEVQQTFILEQVQNDKYTISDGKRIMDLHVVAGNPHAVGMLMAYLPAERILVD